MGVIQSWATVDMIYMHSEGISVIYPSLVFSKQILVNPAWMKKDGTLPAPLANVVNLYTSQGYRVHLKHSEVPPSACATGVDATFFPKTERRFEDGAAFSLAFKVTDVLEAVNGPLSTTVPNVRWRLGGFIRGLITPGHAYFSDDGGPHAHEHWTYNAVDADEQYSLEEIPRNSAR